MTGADSLAAVLPAAILAAWACLLVASFSQESRIFRHLRIYHPAEWEALGRPSGLRRLRNRSVGPFLKSGGYRRLEDQKLDRMMRVMRVLSWSSIAAFIAVLALLAVPWM